MLNLPIDIHAKWSFTHSDGFWPTTVPVVWNKLDHNLSTQIPWGIQGMKIDLDSYDATTKTVKGKYNIIDLDSMDEVTFRVMDEGKRLEGTPSGFHGNLTWTFTKV